MNYSSPEKVAKRRKAYLAAHPLFNKAEKTHSVSSLPETVEDYKRQIQCIDVTILDLLEAKSRAEAAIRVLEGVT